MNKQFKNKNKVKKLIDNKNNYVKSVSLKFLETNNYGFSTLNSPQDRKKFDHFIRLVNSNKFDWESRQQTTDKNDKLKNGEQIFHYKITDKFRIHGFQNGERFKLVRIDPKHEFHS